MWPPLSGCGIKPRSPTRLIGEAPDTRGINSTMRDLAPFRDELVDAFQQRMHDEFVDVSWPRCPLHPNHPMWLTDGVWCCTKDNVAIARLGALATGSTKER